MRLAMRCVEDRLGDGVSLLFLGTGKGDAQTFCGVQSYLTEDTEDILGRRTLATVYADAGLPSMIGFPPTFLLENRPSNTSIHDID